MNRNLPTTSQSGQVLIAVVLTMVVSLIVGLAVSARSLSSLRGSTYTTQSTGAFHAAEAGVEEVLNGLEGGWDTFIATLEGCDGDGDLNHDEYCLPGETALGTTDVTFDYYVETGGDTEDTYVINIEQDDTAEIRLEGYGGDDLNICWDDSGDGGTIVALLLTFIDTGDNITRYAYDRNAAARGNGFTPHSICAGVGCTPVDGGYTYKSCQSFTLPSNPARLRLTPLYGDTPIAITPDQIGCDGDPCPLPAQSYIITATGTVGETERVLQVTKSLPALPPIFNFAIFSGSATIPLSK